MHDAHIAGITGIIEAVENDENIDRKHAQAMFIGPGGSGKSSLMDRMVHKRRAQYLSTGVADSVVILDLEVNPSSFHAVTVLDSDNWQEVKFGKSLVGQMHESLYSLQLQQSQAKGSEVRSTMATEAIANTDSLDSSLSVKSDAARFTKQLPKTIASRPSVSSGIKDVISSVVAKHGGFTNFYNLLKKKFSLYLRDAGGQVEFQEMVSLLVFGPSIFFFVFRADQDFQSTFQVGYRLNASESINCYTSSITTEEALLQCLASVYAMDTQGKASHDIYNPYVFIVATHKDKLGPSAEQKIVELNAYLKALIQKSGFDNLVQYAIREKGQVMFAVNNTSESDDDFKAI